MFSTEEFYAMKTYLNNVLLIKVAFDCGINVKKALKNTYIYPSPYQMDDTNLEIFYELALQTFEAVQFFAPGEDDEDIQYWANLIGETKRDMNSCYLWVILDPLLRNCLEEEVLFNDEFNYGAYTIVHSIDDGVIVIADEDYGVCDWTSVYQHLTRVKEKKRLENIIENELESEPYEVAI